MPHVIKHSTKVSTRSVNPYAREISREKRQQDRHIDGWTGRQTHRRIVQNIFSWRFEGCTSQIRSYLEVDFLHDANTSIDMEVPSIDMDVPSIDMEVIDKNRAHPDRFHMHPTIQTLQTKHLDCIWCVSRLRFASARLLRVMVGVCLPPLPQHWSRDPFGSSPLLATTLLHHQNWTIPFGLKTFPDHRCVQNRWEAVP